MTENVLNYDHSVVPQEQFYDCGPASTQVVLNGRGVIVSENELISDEGTTENGTNDVSCITPVLNQFLPGADYQSAYMPNDPPTQDDKDQLWARITQSIDAGYGLVFNFVAPPSNYPVGVKGSQSPSYGGGVVMHYVSCMGYDDDPALRAVWIADPGFRPFGYWCSFDQVATLIPPKGYAYSAAPAAAPAPSPPAPPVDASPVPGPLFGVDLSNNNWGGRAPADIVPTLNQIASEGFAWIAHKVSEGNYYNDPYWPTVWQWHLDTGHPVVGYHYVTTDSADQQARQYLGNDPSNGTAPCELDFEANSGDINNWVAVFNAFVAAGINVRLNYLPHWYWQQIGSPDLSAVPGLVSSAYHEQNQYASTEYYDSGGDSGDGWAPYGGATPVMWQFTDSALVAGMSMDAMAFKGSIDDLNALLGSKLTDGFLMALSDAEQRELLDAARWVKDQLGPNIWGPASSFGKDAAGDELTVRDGLAELKREVEAHAVSPQERKPDMAFQLPDAGEIAKLHTELDHGIDAVTSVLDFVVKYGKFIPGVGDKIALVEELDAALKTAKAFLDKVPA